MKRSLILAALSLTAVAVLAPALRADVKTTEKTTFKLEGMLGRFIRGGGEGVTSTVALKGPRKLSMNDTTGEIIDLVEQKVYRIDVKKKEYKVVTFEQLRKEWLDTQKEMEKNADQMREAQGQLEESGLKMEIVADIKETGQKKAIAGYNAREVVLTITSKQVGKTLEEGGGTVMTNTLWIGPRIPALDEINEFHVKYMKAVMGEEGAAAMQQMMMVFAMFVSAKPMMEKMQAEGKKLEGSMLASTMLMETVKSAEQMKAAGEQGGGGGGGIGGALARRMMRGRGQTEPRSTVMTTTQEFLTVTTSAAEADVAIPAGFKEKK